MNAVTIAPPPRMGVRPSVAIFGKPGNYTRNKEDHVSRFYKLVRKWRAETAYVSSSTESFEHPAFKDIVAMGAKVIPLIVGELRKQPDLLVGAMVRITGENPVPASDRGNIYAMASAWVEWYNRRS